MPRGPHGAEDVLDPPVHDGVDACHRAAGREKGDVPGRGRDRAVSRREDALAASDAVAEPLEVLGGMDRPEELEVGDVGRQEDEAPPEVLLLDGREKGAEPFVAFRVAGTGLVPKVLGRGHEARPPGCVRVDRLVSLPRCRGEKEGLAQRQLDLLGEPLIGRQRVVSVGIPVDGDPQVLPEPGEIERVVQTPDLDLAHGKALLPDESPQGLLSLFDLGPVGEIESFLSPVVPTDGKRRVQPELAEAEVPEEPLVVAEQRRGVAGALRVHADVVDVDDPDAAAPEKGREPERRIRERREAERHLADALLALEDLRVVEDAVPAEEEETLPVRELAVAGTEGPEEGGGRDPVLEEGRSSAEGAFAAREPC